jgi:hypothetical protein
MGQIFIVLIHWQPLYHCVERKQKVSGLGVRKIIFFGSFTVSRCGKLGQSGGQAAAKKTVAVKSVSALKY